MLGLVVVFVIGRFGGTDDARELTLAQVVERHQRYLERIHTLDAEIETWESTAGGRSWSLTAREHWWKDGPRERYTTSAEGFIDPGGTYRNAPIRYDNSFAPGETRHLNGWDPSQRPAEMPSPANHYHGASGTIAGTVNVGSISARPPFLMMLAATANDYLPDAVRMGMNPAVEQVNLDGRECWAVKFETKVGVPAVVRVTLDPDRGYALVRREVKTKTETPSQGTTDVVEYREVEEGLFIPTRIRTLASNEPSHIYERRVTALKVNEPVRPETLTVKFPEGIKVQDIRSGSTELYHIWGQDGPTLTFDTRQKLLEYESSFFTRSRSSPFGGFLIATGVLIAVTVVLLVLRKRLGARHQAA
jgi:hypothetical protein